MHVILPLPFVDKYAPVKRSWRMGRYAVSICVLAGAAYVVSPLLTLWGLKSAVARHDGEALGRYIDWSSLTQSFQGKINPPSPAQEDDLPGFGSSFATQAASHVLERNLTPATMLSLIDQAMIPHNTINPVKVAVGSGTWTAHFKGIRHFDILFGANAQTLYQVHMTFEHWGWKITCVDLPQEMQQV